MNAPTMIHTNLRITGGRVSTNPNSLQRFTTSHAGIISVIMLPPALLRVLPLVLEHKVRRS